MSEISEKRVEALASNILECHDVKPSEVKALARELRALRKILDGVTQEAIDGGWTARGLSDYAKQLETELAALRERAEPVAGENLPCPFCGGACDPAGWLIEQTSGPECENCGATAENIEAWNRRTAALVVPDDTKRLDWLDAQNKRLNEYYGTAYGWKFDANFQRNAMMLNDSNYPVMTVRQAIDEAMLDAGALRERAEPDCACNHVCSALTRADTLECIYCGILKRDWVRAKTPPAPGVVTRQVLRDLVDAAWMHATESEEVPATTWADSIIDDVLSSAPPAPVVPDGLKRAVEFYEQVKRENTPAETGAWKDAVNWVLDEACRAAMLQPVSQPYKLPVSPEDESKRTKN
ncbi:hypothetical protein R2308_002956 [Cronobacter turicensis]|nr:hypothetical protein [Cronobacter turicensis]